MFLVEGHTQTVSKHRSPVSSFCHISKAKVNLYTWDHQRCCRKSDVIFTWDNGLRETFIMQSIWGALTLPHVPAENYRFDDCIPFSLIWSWAWLKLNIVPFFAMRLCDVSNKKRQKPNKLFSCWSSFRFAVWLPVLWDHTGSQYGQTTGVVRQRTQTVTGLECEKWGEKRFAEKLEFGPLSHLCTWETATLLPFGTALVPDIELGVNH